MYNPERYGHSAAPCYTQPPLAGRIAPYNGPRALTHEMQCVVSLPLPETTTPSPDIEKGVSLENPVGGGKAGCLGVFLDFLPLLPDLGSFVLDVVPVDALAL
jgi:hypothetical protein